jgi:hypothetical protein
MWYLQTQKMKMTALQLNNAIAAYNLEISCNKMKNVAFCGKYKITPKIITDLKF